VKNEQEIQRAIKLIIEAQKRARLAEKYQRDTESILLGSQFALEWLLKDSDDWFDKFLDDIALSVRRRAEMN
jgi:hypothetical protein